MVFNNDQADAWQRMVLGKHKCGYNESHNAAERKWPGEPWKKTNPEDTDK